MCRLGKTLFIILSILDFSTLGFCDAISTKGSDSAIPAPASSWADKRDGPPDMTGNLWWMSYLCSNLASNVKHCGACNNKCLPFGSCVNGLCTMPACSGATCSTSERCHKGRSPNCWCFGDGDFHGFCVRGAFCEDLSDCSKHNDCALGSVCIKDNCCGTPKCMAGSCGQSGKKKRSGGSCLERDEDEGSEKVLRSVIRNATCAVGPGNCS